MLKAAARVVIAVVAVAGLSTIVFAHMALQEAVPAVDSTVTTPPASLQLTFTQPPDLSVSKLDLSGPSGTVELTSLHVMDERMLMAMVSGEMADGEYTVSWQSAGDDGHVQKGTYTFTLKRAAQ